MLAVPGNAFQNQHGDPADEERLWDIFCDISRHIFKMHEQYLVDKSSKNMLYLFKSII